MNELNIYGSIDEPLFLAKDVAEWIEYDKNQVGKMLSTVDEDEKIKLLCDRNNITGKGNPNKWFLTEDDEDEKAASPIYYIGQVRNMWFLTEDGLIFCYRLWPIANLFFDYILYI